MKKVALVIGHSFKEQGAHNKAFNVSEWQFNSELVPMVANELAKLEIQPLIFYRDELKTLPSEINAADVDAIVSFHCNAFNEIASGTETLYHEKSKKGKTLANVLQNAVTDCLGLRNRGTIPLTEGKNGYFLLSKTNAPAVILETMFIDNSVDYVVAEGALKDLSKDIAKAISIYF